MKILILIITILASSISMATTIVKVDTTPVHANVSCNSEKKGIAPLRFALEDGKYECTLTHKLTEPISFSLEVNNDESIYISLILIPGNMTKEQKKVSLHRVHRKKRAATPPPKDYSKEAEEYLLTKHGAEAQRLINKLVELKQPASDGGSTLTASELNELKRLEGSP